MLLSILNFLAEYKDQLFIASIGLGMIMIILADFFLAFSKNLVKFVFFFAAGLCSIVFTAFVSLFVSNVSIDNGVCFQERKHSPYSEKFAEQLLSRVKESQKLLSLAKQRNASNIPELEAKLADKEKEYQKVVKALEELKAEPYTVYSVLEGNRRPLIALSQNNTVETVHYHTPSLRFVECSREMTASYNQFKEIERQNEETKVSLTSKEDFK